MKRFPLGLVPIAALMASSTPARGELPPSTVAADRVVAVARAAHLSGEIALADREGPIVDRAIGLADRERRDPHRVGERWLWASVTKQVTAVLVMQQVEAGTLALDGTVATYLPDFPGATGARITVRQLLQHTSGLPNPDDTPAPAGGPPAFYVETGASITDAARAQSFCSGPLKSRPGAGFAYNNCDYLVLGAILERVTGQSYASLVADRLAKAAGPHAVVVAPDGTARGGSVAIGYTDEGRRAAPVNVATFGAAGALTGSAADLLRFDRALLADRFMQPAARAILWTGDPALGYEALGAWSFPAPLRGCPSTIALVERRGDVGGIQVRNVIAPELGRALVVFTNDDSLDFGEVWQGRGLAYDLLSAAFCPTDNSGAPR